MTEPNHQHLLCYLHKNINFIKNSVLLIFLFLTCVVNAQKYTFDTMVTYSRQSETQFNMSSCTNSKDNSYILQIGNRAVLYDFKNQKTHYFDIVSDGNLKFSHSLNLNSEKYSYPNYVFEFEKIETTDSYEKVRLNVYKNKKKKKISVYYDLVLKPNEQNLFTAFRVSTLHPFELTEKLNLQGNYVVESAKGTTLSGKPVEINLTDYKKINFELQVP